MPDIVPSLILLRGLPGSGKSSLALLISEEGRYGVHSIDSYFTDTGGNYRFNYRENHLAYEACLRSVETEMISNAPKIIVDNTFTMDWEMEPYFRLAAEYGYRVHVATVENYHGGRNVHGIPDDHLRKMAEKFKVRLLPDAD